MTEGIILLNKPPGLTSFEALYPVKKAFNTGKAGHTGTLDKFASGLLLAALGRALKLIPYLSGGAKEYLGTIRFGVETSTLDPEGEVIARGALPAREDIERVLPLFRGEILQAPPAFSAVHVGGKRAHVLARAGEAPEMKRRPVTVHGLELLSYEPFAAEARIRVECSAGTYIRSLARDIALAAGTRAYLTELTRTRIGGGGGKGGFCLEEAVGLDDPARLAGAIRPPSPALFGALGIPSFFVDEETAQKIRRGKPLGALLETAGLRLPPAGSAAAVFSGSGESPLFTAMLQRKGGAWGYGYVWGN